MTATAQCNASWKITAYTVTAGFAVWAASCASLLLVG